MSRTFDIILGTAVLVFLIAAIAVGFFLILKRSYDPAKMFFKIAFTVPFAIYCIKFGVALGWLGPFVIVFMGVVLSVMWTPHISELLFKPITSLYDGGDEPPEPKPFYSVALAKRKRGQFLEAAMETRKQLDRFPNDYEGVLLLAAIQAEDLKDLTAAENTLNIFCNAEGSPPLQICAALTQLADWHLKLAQDTDSAQIFLERIIALYPNTIQAAQAAERIAHLGGTKATMELARERQPAVVPGGIQSAGLRDTIRELVPEEADPKKSAADYVNHLAQHPDDAEAREKLALIYANHFQRLDLAALELNQLIEQPEQPAKRVAHWLNLLADLQVRVGVDHELIRQTLERIIEKFPDYAVAEMARLRINRLKLEIKGQKETPGTKKLGDYEQNIGLKGDRYFSPRQL
ncbi:MAG TPA: tetratricopeptide repeat protein [Verrucomicrobiae bacterium]|nr:tetratricopeptide repeat protein [Verrucomicrobiae bacterium]